MRLIDADKVISLIMNDGIYCDTDADKEYSAKRIRELPTIDAIPREHIEQMENEFIHIGEVSGWLDISLSHCLEIIDKYTKEQTDGTLD